MIDEFKTYPKYKDSGVEWLGNVPEHWEVQEIGRIGQLFKGNGGNKGDEATAGIPCIRYGDLYTKYEFFVRETRTFVSTKRVTDYTSTRYGDVLFAASGETIEDIGRSAVNLIETESCCGGDILVLRPEADAMSEFLGYAADSPASRHQKSCMGRGFTVVHIYGSQLKRLALPLPPLIEQTTIVRFLDWADRRIQRVIRAREKRIKLLGEYKQALIHQAVTGQIDVRTRKPFPKYKDSGVEWLGKVPEHWEVRPLKRIVRLNPSKSEISTALRSADAVFLPMEKVGADGRIDTSIVKRVSKLWNGFTYFRRNDVIVAKITPCFENGKGACLTNLPTEIGFGSTEFHVLRPSSAILPDFLYLVTILREFRQLGVEAMTGAAGQQRVPSTFIEQFPTCRPPLPEQTAIVEFLDEQTERIDTAITTDRHVIDLLKEFRMRLIADVVTGKLDIRGYNLVEESDTTPQGG